MCRPPSSDGVRRRACGLPYPASGRQSRLSVALHVCFFSGAPRRRRRGHCPPFHARIPLRRRLIVQRCLTGGGEAVIPRPVVRGPIAVALPRSLSPGTLTPTVLSVQLPAMLIVRRRDGVPSSAGDPTLITQVKVRTRVKSITGFSLSKPVTGFKTGYRFSGSRLTSLIRKTYYY